MGNKCPACLCGADRASEVKCGGSKKKRKTKKSESVLPTDLHSSGAQKNLTGESGNRSQRPDCLSLPTQHSNAKETKFPDFSLHGVQKSSPPSCSSTPIQSSKDHPYDPANVEILFRMYKDDVEDLILADGVERLCSDLEVDPTEFVVLVLAWKLKASTMCRFTRDEFISGCQEMKCDSISSIRSSFPRILKDAEINFKELYRFTFQFALDADEGQRSLPCDIAIAMWNVVFSTNQPSILQSWIQFLQERNVRGISRDTWHMFLYLVDAISEDIENYNDNEAWPSLFDDFVQYKKDAMTKIEEEKVVVVTTDVAAGDSPSQRMEIPGSISTSGENTPEMAGNSPTSHVANENETKTPETPSVEPQTCGNSPGEILSHLHSENEVSSEKS
ncbi:DCN1-like protein 3 [Ciona intestinalis]